MLPAAAYTSADVLAWERRHLFAGTWSCVGREEDLRADRQPLGIEMAGPLHRLAAGTEDRKKCTWKGLLRRSGPAFQRPEIPVNNSVTFCR